MPTRALVPLLLLALAACGDAGGDGGDGGVGGGTVLFNVGPEHPLDSTSVTVPAADDQSMPALAGGSSGFAAVWSDFNRRNRRIAATLVAANGALSSPTGIAVFAPEANRRAAVVAGNGQFLFAVGDALRIRRLSASGTLLDQQSTPLGVNVAPGIPPAGAFTGGLYLLAWSRGDGTVAAARVAPDSGQAADGPGLTAARLASLPSRVFAAGAGGIFLVGWAGAAPTGCPECRLARVSTGGVVLDPSGLALPLPGGEVVAIGSDGQSRFLVLYRANGGGLTALALAASGGFLGPPVPLGVNPTGEVAIAFAGDRYIVAATTPANQLGAFLLTVGGAPASVAVTLVPESSCVRAPSVAASGGTALFAWRDAPTASGSSCVGLPIEPPGDIRAIRTDLGLNRLDREPVLLSATSDPQTAPAMAVSGAAGALVAWQDARRADGTDTVAVHVAASGEPADAGGATRLTREGDHGEPAPLFASDSEGYAVAWEEAGRRAIRGARMALAGNGTPDPGGQAVVTGQELGSLSAARGTGPGVFVFAAGLSVLAVRVGADLLPLDRAPLLLGGYRAVDPSERSRFTRVAANGATLLALAWTRGSRDEPQVSRVRFADDGTVLDAGLEPLAAIGPATAAVAPLGSGWVASYVSAAGGLEVVTVDADGDAGSPVAVSSEGTDMTVGIGLGGVGNAAALVWDASPGDASELFATTVGESGAVAGIQRLFDDGIDRRRPAVVPLGPGQYLIAYERASEGAPRVYAARLDVR